MIDSLDSKSVDKELRRQFWPRLKEAGFERRTGRTAWRDRTSAIQCASVQSFNSYLADRMGATTYSFGINLGLFFPGIAARSAKTRFVRDLRRPKEHECHIRKFLHKGLSQPNVPVKRLFGLLSDAPSLGRWSDRPDVWLVLPDGSNLEAVIDDAVNRTTDEGLAWLESVAEPREAIRRMLEEPDVFSDDGVMLEMYGGTIGSPSRWQALGALAASIGDRELLERSVEAMSQQPYWVDHAQDLETLRADLAPARDIRAR